MRLSKFLLTILITVTLLYCSNPHQKKADEFLVEHNSEFQKVLTPAATSSWNANIDISEYHDSIEVVKNQAYYDFLGKKENVEQAKELLKHADELNEITVKQLETVLYNAAHGPGTIPEKVKELVNADTKQKTDLYSFQFKLDGKNVSANEIDKMLLNETNVEQRAKIWESSKEVGKVLKDGLSNLQRVRNEVSREMGYSSFFDLETANYGMSADEMRNLMEKVYEEIKPLYAQLYTWTKYRLADKYNQPVPEKIPAHWLTNRWSQEWRGLVEGVDMDDLFKDKSPEWLVEQAERFYVSMGFSELPESFYELSDLYPAPVDGDRKKNSHASAWHINQDNDVRSLMSVENNHKWFSTTHHELGHVYYFIAYSNPQVPMILREGANRGYHEGIGELISIASNQTPYLEEIGLLNKDDEIDKIKWLLNEALENVVFMPWSTGVMTNFEYELYEKELPKDEYNKRWWELVEKYQGIVPPTNRGEEYCDAASKTHINNDPAQYYDYAVAKLLQYQFHNYICKNILKTDPQNANYYNNKQIGNYLNGILSVGATEDWRELLIEKTGSDLSAKPMLEYFAPLMQWLQKENEGREIAQF